MMRRELKTTDDEAAIVQAIDAFLPAYSKHSWALSREIGSGAYVRIGRLNVPRATWGRILKDQGIVMAEHYRESTIRVRPRIFDYRHIKSRFGETYVVRYLQGGVRRCDNVHATEFYNAAQRTAVMAICAEIDGGDLDAAKAEKKRQQRAGLY